MYIVQSECDFREGHDEWFALIHTKLDHCSCLLKRDKDWSLVDCLSAVELKINDSKGCEAFDSAKEIHECVQLKSLHGALAAQVTSYTMGWVLPSLTNIGQVNQVCLDRVGGLETIVTCVFNIAYGFLVTQI